jgi:putative proteasome-type protease
LRVARAGDYRGARETGAGPCDDWNSDRNCAAGRPEPLSMTYCVGLLLDAGLVMLADTRTNAGLDNIAVYRKMFVFEASGDRAIVMMTAGNLSVTQTTIARLRHEIAREGSEESIMQAGSMLEVAGIVGRTLNDTYVEIGKRMERTKYSASAAMLLGGQRHGGQMRLFLIYPEGNFIEATDDTPFLQIGEHKYGKPILDRVVRPSTSLDDGRKAALISMDSTLRSNLSVGMPLDLLTIRRNEYRVATRERIEPGDPRFVATSEAWSHSLREGFGGLPDIPVC